MKTRLLSMLLSLCMALTMFPAGAFAAQPEQEQPQTSEPQKLEPQLAAGELWEPNPVSLKQKKSVQKIESHYFD